MGGGSLFVLGVTKSSSGSPQGGEGGDPPTPTDTGPAAPNSEQESLQPRCAWGTPSTRHPGLRFTPCLTPQPQPWPFPPPRALAAAPSWSRDAQTRLSSSGNSRAPQRTSRSLSEGAFSTKRPLGIRGNLSQPPVSSSPSRAAQAPRRGAACPQAGLHFGSSSSCPISLFNPDFFSLWRGGKRLNLPTLLTCF